LHRLINGKKKYHREDAEDAEGFDFSVTGERPATEKHLAAFGRRFGRPAERAVFLNRRLSRRFKKKTSSAFFAPPAKRAVNLASAKRVMG